MKLKIAFIRPTMRGKPSRDAMMPLVFAIIRPLTPPDVELMFYDERVEALPQCLDAPVVAMAVETFSARRAYRLADRFRRAGKRVVMGGFHPTLLPEECLQHADSVVVGEAEDTWGQVVADLRADALQRVYRSANNADLSRVVYDYSVFRGKRYHKVGLAQFSRGCRCSCEFCSIHAFYGHAVRCKTIPAMVAELRAMRERYVFLIDDNLFADRAAARALFTAMIGLRKKWFCQISMDAARDLELLRLMRRSGCLLALIGFESLDGANLRQMGKRANQGAADYAQIVANLNEAGIMVYGTFVVGYDADTKHSASALADFALRYGFALANFNPLMPMPGTRLLRRLEEEGRLAFDKWWLNPAYRYGDAMLRPRGMRGQALMESCWRARWRFNTHGNILKRLLVGAANRRNLENATLFLLANFVSRAEIYAKQGRPLGGEVDESDADQAEYRQEGP